MDSNQQHGFTLVELMITITILAIITAIAIPAYQGYISSAKRTECLNTLTEITLAQEEFFLENNRYFSGVQNSTTTDGLKTNSGGFYSKEYLNTDNCTYAVVAGPTGDIATSYVLTATGTNQLSGTIKTFTKQ